MKKIFLFCLSIVFGLLMIGCPNSETKPECDVEPGTVEKIPADVAIMVSAKEKLVEEGKLTNDQIAFFYYRPDGNYTNFALWMWADGGDGNNNYKAFAAAGYTTVDVDDKKVGYMKFNTDGSTTGGAIALTGEELEVIQNKGNFNFIVVKDKGDGTAPNWDTKDYAQDLYWDIMQSNHFGVVSKTGSVYSIERNAKPRICGAVMVGIGGLRVQLSQKYALQPTAESSGFSLYCTDDGKTASVNDCYSYDYYGFEDELDRKKNFTNNIFMKIPKNLDLSKSWVIKHSAFNPSNGYAVSTGSAIKEDISKLKYEGDDLGLTLNGTKAGFKVFAPLASAANVLTFDTYTNAKVVVNNISGSQTVTDTLTGGTRTEMTLDKTTGVWSAADVDISGKTYYMYELVNLGKVYRVCDINALVAGPDSIAAQIISIDDAACKPDNWETKYTNPFGNSGAETKNYSDAVIYEMHIRDWSKGLSNSNTGKFDEITAGLGTNGAGTLGQHLKDLGVTHVQILPMFDYAQKNSDPDYNWGYNPYHYNVPEGRYTNNHDNGGNEAVKQMRAMIKAFHDAGIAVNMDVVYNHTDGTKTGSLYDMTVPFYYYRLVNGEYSNGSGCGNETDSSALMFRKYMIDSLSHWMKDYHINGFRFDLMGLHETEAMKAVYEALYAIDKNVMVYGEPWTGGGSAVVNGVDKTKIDQCWTGLTQNGVACFNDSYRNAIKGGEFGGFEQGQVQGKFNPTAISSGLKGSPEFTELPDRSLNYVECHDNYTLFDKLDISAMNGTGKTAWVAYDNLTTEIQDDIRAQNKLAAAFVFLAQGTPFINGGQEFMRTKQGDENSYVSSDEINAINLSYKDKFSDVYNVYKGLIALRKAHPVFRKATEVTVSGPKAGVTRYVISDANEEFAVVFNASNNAYSVSVTKADEDVTQATPYDVTSGTPTAGNAVTELSAAAKSFSIYKLK